MKKAILVMLCVWMIALTSAVFAGPAADAAKDVPWWKQHKINFMWGQWGRSRIDKSASTWRSELPRDVFRNVALSGSGGTVYAEMLGYIPVHAKHAHDFGMKYFATLFVYELHKFPGQRKAMTKDGKPGAWGSPWCTLDQDVYEKWMVEPHLEGIRQGLIDGMHMDWERYGGKGEADMCYCDDCFTKFPDFKKTGDKLPENINRLAWITDRDLAGAYEENYHTRRFEMFTRIRQKLQTANPNLIFSSYGTLFSDFTRAMNTSEVPFIFLDARHYYNDDRQAWWESYGSRLRKEGYLYIPGCYGGLFGSQANQVSAARWFYEAAINEDGYWMWFERELDDEILRAYSTANRQIKSVLLKVGDFLFDGTRDDSFVTTVEWTGRPELEQAIIHQSYHLGNKHLVHINNVDAAWPVRVRLRFPRLLEGAQWTVRDAMGDLYYTHDDKSANWTREDLLAGVVITLEPRSDLFLVLSAPDAIAIAPSRLIHSRVFNTLEDHDAASKGAGPIKNIVELYHMKNAIDRESLVALLTTTEKVWDVPKDGWRFKMDKEDEGASKKWYLPAAPIDDWVDIETEAFWGTKGSTGAGWYRKDIDVPTLPDGKLVYLHFGAVDEQLVLWIDGKYAGDYNRSLEGWDKPFAIDVTGKLTAGKHHIAMRILNEGAAGGVWKPVSVLVGPETHSECENMLGDIPKDTQRAGSTPTGRLLYTAAEKMGYSEGSGTYTLGNAIRMVDTPWKVGPRLRQLRGHLWSPRYSPAGMRIVFVHDANGRGQIFIMNANGSNATNISNNNFSDRSPRWSPDGKQVTFISDRTGDWEVYVMNTNSSDLIRISNNKGLDRAPAWSPDGKTIAWESHVSGMPNIWIADTNGKNSRPLIGQDQPLKILKGKSGQNNVFNFALAEWPFADNTFLLTDPVWSPNGKRIAAVLLDSYSGSSVVLVDADGSQMLNVIKDLPRADHLAWSPDGSQLAGTWRTAPSETEQSGIFVVKTDGTDKNKHGKWLVDVTPQGPRMGGAKRFGLMSWYSHGSALPSRVMKSFTSVAWSTNGKTIAFSSDMHKSGAFYVYTIPAEGGEPSRIEITRSAWPQQIMWQPN